MVPSLGLISQNHRLQHLQPMEPCSYWGTVASIEDARTGRHFYEPGIGWGPGWLSFGCDT